MFSITAPLCFIKWHNCQGIRRIFRKIGQFWLGQTRIFHFLHWLKFSLIIHWVIRSRNPSLRSVLRWDRVIFLFLLITDDEFFKIMLRKHNTRRYQLHGMIICHYLIIMLSLYLINTHINHLPFHETIAPVENEEQPFTHRSFLRLRTLTFLFYIFFKRKTYKNGPKQWREMLA